MSLQRFTSFCHARTFFALNTRLSVRLCSSKISKNLKSAKLYEPRDVVHNYYNFNAARERFFKPSVRCISTAYHLLQESSISTGEKTSATVKDEATIISQLNSEFYEEEADIPNRQPKPRATVVQYKLDQNGFMKVQDLVDFLKKESAVDICVIKTRGIRQNYVDYFVVVSGVSTRHIRAMAKNLELLVGWYYMLLTVIIYVINKGCYRLGIAGNLIPRVVCLPPLWGNLDTWTSKEVKWLYEKGWNSWS